MSNRAPRHLVPLTLFLLDLAHLIPVLLFGLTALLTLAVTLTPVFLPQVSAPGWLPWLLLPTGGLVFPLLGVCTLFALGQLHLATDTTDRLWATVIFLSLGLLSAVHWFSRGRRALSKRLQETPTATPPAAPCSSATASASASPLTHVTARRGPSHTFRAEEDGDSELPVVVLLRRTPSAFQPADSGTLAPTTLHVIAARRRRA